MGPCTDHVPVRVSCFSCVKQGVGSEWLFLRWILETPQGSRHMGTLPCLEDSVLSWQGTLPRDYGSVSSALKGFHKFKEIVYEFDVCVGICIFLGIGSIISSRFSSDPQHKKAH